MAGCRTAKMEGYGFYIAEKGIERGMGYWKIRGSCLGGVLFSLKEKPGCVRMLNVEMAVQIYWFSMDGLSEITEGSIG